MAWDTVRSFSRSRLGCSPCIIHYEGRSRRDPSTHIYRLAFPPCCWRRGRKRILLLGNNYVPSGFPAVRNGTLPFLQIPSGPRQEPVARVVEDNLPCLDEGKRTNVEECDCIDRLRHAGLAGVHERARGAVASQLQRALLEELFLQGPAPLNVHFPGHVAVADVGNLTQCISSTTVRKSSEPSGSLIFCHS